MSPGIQLTVLELREEKFLNSGELGSKAGVLESATSALTASGESRSARAKYDTRQ